MGCDFAPASRALAGLGREIEICQGVSCRKLDLLRNRAPPVRASSRDWPVALLSLSPDPKSDCVLRTPAFGDASYGHIRARLTRGRSGLFSILPCRLGHSLCSGPVGIPLAAHPGCPGRGNGHSFHHDNGLALFRGCAWWSSSRHYFDPFSETSHATNADHPPPTERTEASRPVPDNAVQPRQIRGAATRRGSRSDSLPTQ